MQKLQERYDIRQDDFLFTYKFTSVGKKGEISKLIQYNALNLKDYYNLAFGDETQEGTIDDMVVSDNGDGQKVLATVAATVYDFTNENPNAFIFATGSSASRTRLYRIGISNNYAEIKEDFEIYGFLDEKWEDFELNRPYEAFLLKRK